MPRHFLNKFGVFLCMGWSFASLFVAAVGAEPLTSQPAQASVTCEESLSPYLFRHSPAQAKPLSADRAKNARLKVQGGQTLSGAVTVDPAKNAYLPILAAALLSEEPVELLDVPALRDMETFLDIFANLGVGVSVNGRITTIDAAKIQTNIATCELIKTMRASILILGPLLSRFQAGMVGLPGGCPIGSRPIDIHIDALKKMGAEIRQTPDWILAEKQGRLKGSELNFSFPSVGATQHLIMAAVLAEGHTSITGAAREPEVEDLIRFLNERGAKITSDGRGTVRIQGVERLKHGSPFRAIGDRIEAATYIIGALMTGAQLEVKGFSPSHIQSVLDTLTAMGARLDIGADFVRVRKSPPLKAAHVVTGPHPQFPTDVQAQLMALMTQAHGSSSIQETIFENRFQHAAEMNKMGGNISVTGDRALIEGPSRIYGTKVKCTDLRGGVALILNALIAQGESELSDIYYVDRGYHRFLEKFSDMGACRMERVDE